MTAGELARYLATLDPGLKVTISYDNGNGEDDIVSAHVRKREDYVDGPCLVLSTERDGWAELVDAEAPHYHFVSRNGIGFRLEALLDVPPDTLAKAARQETAAFLADLDRWSRDGEGFMYGVTVDVEAGTISRVQVAR